MRSSTELDKALSVCQSRGDSLTSAVATVSCRPVAHPGGTPLAGARNSDSVRSGLAPEFAFLTSSRETLVSLVPGPHLEDACPRGRRQRPSDGAPGGRAGFRPQGRAGRRVRADGGRCCRRAWGPGRGTRNRALGPGEGGCAADWWVSTARSCSHPAGSDAVAKRPGQLWKAGWGSWHRERRGTAGPAGSAAWGRCPGRTSSCHLGRAGCHPSTPRSEPDPLRVGLASLSSCAPRQRRSGSPTRQDNGARRGLKFPS